MIAYDGIYRNNDWNIEIDLSDTNFSIDTNMDTDTMLNSGFCKLTLPEMNCKVENIDFKPEVRILDKYLLDDSINYKLISQTLYDYLDKESEILSSMMCPDDFGQLFGFVIQRENRFLYNYHLIKVNEKNILIECVETFGTKKQVDIELKKLIKGTKSIKN
jgi:hypothetical protein